MPVEYIEATKWVLPATKELYKNRHDIMSGWEAFIAKLVGPKSSVAFVGPGGVGKTALFDHITGSAYKSGYKTPGRSRSQEKGKARVGGNQVAIVVAPGQGGPQLDSFEDIFGPNKNVDGIVFVASNGLVTLRRDDAIQQNIKAGLDTIEKWRDSNLKSELKYLKEVASKIRSSNFATRKPKWMLVAATKVDLLPDQINKIEEYYSPHGDSEFSRTLNEIVSAIGTDNFEWDAVPVCSALDNFVWGEQHIPSQLDEEARDHYLSYMVDTLGRMCR